MLPLGQWQCHLQACVYVWVCVCVCVCCLIVCVCACVCMCLCVCVCVCVWVCVSVCVLLDCMCICACVCAWMSVCNKYNQVVLKYQDHAVWKWPFQYNSCDIFLQLYLTCPAVQQNCGCLASKPKGSSLNCFTCNACTNAHPLYTMNATEQEGLIQSVEKVLPTGRDSCNPV